MKTVEVFPTAIWYDTVEAVDNSRIVEFANALKDGSPQKRFPNNYFGYGKGGDYDRWLSFYLDERQITNSCPEIAKVRNHALSMGKEVLATLGANAGVELAFDNCWLNVNEKGEITRPHIHPGTIITCTYYVRTPDGCGNLVLENADNTVYWNFPPRLFRNRTRYTKVVETIVPSESMMVMFPANVMHYVEPNCNDVSRMSLTFNFIMRPPKDFKDPHYK
jgi:uncharacterized protein (TIGR02466 family)